MPPVVELNKAIYGLPKSTQYFDQYFEEFLSTQLLKLEFVRTVSDKKLFVLLQDDNICYISTYVDDLFVTFTPASGLHVWIQTELKNFHVNISP